MAAGRGGGALLWREALRQYQREEGGGIISIAGAIGGLFSLIYNLLSLLCIGTIVFVFAVLLFVKAKAKAGNGGGAGSFNRIGMSELHTRDIVAGVVGAYRSLVAFVKGEPGDGRGAYKRVRKNSFAND